MQNKTKNRNTLTGYFNLWRRNFRLIWDAVPGLTFAWGVLLLVQGLIPGLTVYLTKHTIDGFVASRSATEGDPIIYRTVVFFLLTGFSLVASELFRFLSDYVRTAQGEHFSDYLKDLMHAKSASVDLEFYESPSYHDLMEQARGDSQSKPLAILDNLGSVIQNTVTLVSFGAILLVYGWLIPFLLLVGTLPGLYVSLKFNRVYHNWWEASAHDRRWLMYFDAMLSHSDAAAEMRLFDLSGRFRARYQGVRSKLRGEKLAQMKQQFSGKILANMMTFLTAGAAVGWIALRVFYNQATLGDLAVFYQVFSRGQMILSAILGGVGQSISNTLFLENLFTYLNLDSKVTSPSEPVAFPTQIRSGIRFRNVTFRYPGEERSAITNFSLFIPAGTTAAIVGINGAGKSTLIKLACRFYDPQEGSVEIDDIDVRHFDVRELRRNISVLFQFPMRFQETAAETIGFGDKNDTDNRTRLQHASERAGAHAFVAKLPNGYNSLLGKWFLNGSELSGGEWQKIALARAYYKDAQLLILDEPTSFMDSWGEADWFDRFQELSRNRTGLIITHRFTIAMRADVIHVLDGGRLVEAGTHAQLIAMNGLYASSWNTQMRVAEEQLLSEAENA